MNNRKKLVLIVIGVLLLGFAGLAALLNISDTDKKAKGNMIVRKATPQEIENAKTAKYVDEIATEFGKFLFMPEAPVPSEGVVYNLSDINKNTKMVIIGDKKFMKTND